MGIKKRRTRKKKAKRKIWVFRDYSKVDLILGISYLGLILVLSGYFLFRGRLGEVDFSTPNPTSLEGLPRKPTFEVRPAVPEIPDASAASTRHDEDTNARKTEETFEEQTLFQNETNKTSREPKSTP